MTCKGYPWSTDARRRRALCDGRIPRAQGDVEPCDRGVDDEAEVLLPHARGGLAALREGADEVLPHRADLRRRGGQLQQLGQGIDIHLHEPGELGLFTARKIIERTRALDYRGRVTIAHAFFLGEIGEGVRSALLDELAELDIALTTVAPGGRGELPMLEILDHGIRLGLGQDGQRDYWSPYGNTDMLDRAWQLAFTNNLRRDADIESVLETATVGGARVMDAAAFSRASRGFAVGDPADYVLVPGETPTSAVMDRPGGRIVVHDGCVVAVDGAPR